MKKALILTQIFALLIISSCGIFKKTSDTETKIIGEWVMSLENLSEEERQEIEEMSPEEKEETMKELQSEYVKFLKGGKYEVYSGGEKDSYGKWKLLKDNILQLFEEDDEEGFNVDIKSITENKMILTEEGEDLIFERRKTKK